MRHRECMMKTQKNMITKWNRICKGVWMLCGIWLVIIMNYENVHAESPKLHARSALLMDASNGRVLFEENGYEVMPNASTTKIMTCILALEYMDANREHCERIPVEVSQKAASMPKVHLGMRQGETYLLRDLLYSLMLESHNDTAVAIAEYVAGSMENFADMMNQKARDLGCRNTYFVTPNGLDRERDGKWHVTCAYDLGLITAYAMKNEQFRDVITTREKQITDCSGKRMFQLYNKDAFLDMMDGACGVKTGFTAKAGYCFVGALEREGRKYISVVLACGWPPNKTWKWQDTKQLMEYGLNEYQNVCINESYSYEKIQIPVTDGTEDYANIYLDATAKEKDAELTLLMSDSDKVRVARKIKKELKAPVERGTIVGYEIYEVNGERYKVYPIKCAETVNLCTYFYCVRQIFMLYFIRM